MTGADFIDRLTDRQRAAYVDGAVEMLAYSFAASGDDRKASRTIDWYYRGHGPQQLARAVRNHRDLPVAGVLQVLVNRL